MRVTTSTNTQTILRDMAQNLQRFQDAQRQITSGRRINRPSDDPVGVVDALRVRSQLRANAMFARHADDAKSRIDTSDNVLNTVDLRLSRVRELALQGANGSSDAVMRGAIATEIREIRRELIATANTNIGGQPLFAGTGGSNGAYDTNGNYIGSFDTEVRTIDAGTTIDVGVPGPNVFGDEADNVFNTLNDLASAIETGDTVAISDVVTRLDSRMTEVRVAHAEIGVRARRVEEAAVRIEDNDLNLRSVLSGIEDVDLAEASMSLSSRQSAYEASLAAAAKSLQSNLLDYLR